MVAVEPEEPEKQTLRGLGDEETERLHDEAQRGNPGGMSEMIKAGVDVNKADRHGSTALMLASTNGHDACVRVLLEAGADVNKGDNGGITALMLASMGGSDACVRQLIEAGAELKQACEAGWTALMWACRNGREACTLTLLNAGADPLAVSKAGKTAAQLAEELSQHPVFSAEARECCRRCIELLQQPRQFHP